MPFSFFSSLASRNRYFRAQVVAVLATSVDFTLTILLKEAGGAYYVQAVACGAMAGAVTAFVLNRTWVFDAAHLPARRQAARYLLTLAGSAALNTAGTWAVTEITGAHYLVSKTCVSILIGLTYSYAVLKHFVFAYEKR